MNGKLSRKKKKNFHEITQNLPNTHTHTHTHMQKGWFISIILRNESWWICWICMFGFKNQIYLSVARFRSSTCYIDLYRSFDIIVKITSLHSNRSTGLYFCGYSIEITMDISENILKYPLRLRQLHVLIASEWLVIHCWTFQS